MALDWAPQPIFAPDIALQLPMAMASAWPAEASVADPQEPSGAMVTTVQSSWSGTMASAGMTRHVTIAANTCNRFMFSLQRVSSLIGLEDAPTGEGTLGVGLTSPEQFPSGA